MDIPRILAQFALNIPPSLPWTSAPFIHFKFRPVEWRPSRRCLVLSPKPRDKSNRPTHLVDVRPALEEGCLHGGAFGVRAGSKQRLGL